MNAILDHSYKILAVACSGSGKTIVISKLIKSKMMLIVVLLIKLIYMIRIQMKQNIISPSKSVKNIENYNLGIKCIVSIIFGDIICNKKLNQIQTEMFFRRIKLNTTTVFIKQSYFTVPNDVRLSHAHLLLWKFQSNEKVSNQILTLKSFWNFTKNAL